ncbi:MAG: hypothetical protein JO216_18135 [Hyphomicrobiales bacterium]|nr:hypothetical protein [Hyphomicrobiales bacterium]
MTDASAVMESAPNSEFRIGLVFRQTFGILGQAFWRYFVISLIAMIVPILFAVLAAGLGIWAASGAAHVSKPIVVGGIIFGFVFYFALALTVQGAIAYGAFQNLRGRRFRIGEALRYCLGKFWPLLGTSFLLGLVIGLGMVALVVPGVVALMCYFVAVPVCVVEDRRPMEALSRSSELTSGYRWKLLGLELILIIGYFLLSYALKTVFSLLAGAFITQLLSFLLQVIFTVASGILAAVVYYNLRVLKEGLDIDQIASVFD